MAMAALRSAIEIDPSPGRPQRGASGDSLANDYVARHDLIRAMIYPDSDDTAATSSGGDNVYDRLICYDAEGEEPSGAAERSTSNIQRSILLNTSRRRGTRPTASRG